MRQAMSQLTVSCCAVGLRSTQRYEKAITLERAVNTNDIVKTERLIGEINRIHRIYSEDYFETGKVVKVNLSQTIAHVSTEHILAYRLNLHESINDYLLQVDLADVVYYYRVKTSEAILDKINRYAQRSDQYPVQNWMNDIFGCRIVLPDGMIDEVISCTDEWQSAYGLKNWYLREKQGYRGVHVYFKNQSNFYFPWELQIWEEQDIAGNVESHRRFKRGFVKNEGQVKA
jgi:hypothetical protein